LFQCDDTRDCIIQFCPPDDEHMRSKHVEAWNKLIIKFSASSWLVLRNKNWLLCLSDFDIRFFYVLVAYPEKLEETKEKANKKLYSHQNQDVSVIKRRQSKDAKPKMRERKLKNGLNQQGAFEQRKLNKWV